MKLKHRKISFPNIKMALASFVIAIMLGGCQEEIDINLNDAEPKVVIESEITDMSPPYLVRISHTVNFKEPNRFVGIGNAVVYLRDEANNREQLAMDSTGFYSAHTIQAQEGQMYYLDVTIDDKNFSTSCKMPYATEIDSLTMTTYAYGSISMKTTEVYFQDRAGESNFYRIKYLVNSELRTNYLYSDEDRDGQQIIVTIFGDNPYNEKEQLKAGDTIDIELYTITKEIFNYFRSLRSTSSTSPANPTSNIDGALGYFNACTKRHKRIIVPL